MLYYILILLILYYIIHAQCQVGLVGTLPEYQLTTRLGQPSFPVPPGSEYMGVGYDIVLGNPAELDLNGSIDPGYRLGIIQNEYRLVANTASYQECLGCNLKIMPVCNHAATAQQIDTIQQYQKFLLADIAIMIPIFEPIVVNNTSGQLVTPQTLNDMLGQQPNISYGAPIHYIPINELQQHNINTTIINELIAAFALSVGAEKIVGQLAATDMLSFYSRSLCLEYTVEYRSYVTPNFTIDFNNGISTLPMYYPSDSDTSDQAALNRALFFAFIQEYGTHYVHRLVGGAKRIIVVTMKRDTVAWLQGNGINVAEAAAFDITLSDMVNQTAALQAQQQLWQSISVSILERREITIGGSPFVNWQDWARSVSESDRAVPIQTTLKPIYSLIQGPRAIALQQAINAYIAAAAQHASNVVNIPIQPVDPVVLTALDSSQISGSLYANDAFSDTDIDVTPSLQPVPTVAGIANDFISNPSSMTPVVNTLP